MRAVAKRLVEARLSLGIIALLALGLAFFMLLRAFDTGSLLQYGSVLLLLIVSAQSGLRALKK